jgi:WD40 repeat protein
VCPGRQIGGTSLAIRDGNGGTAASANSDPAHSNSDPAAGDRDGKRGAIGAGKGLWARRGDTQPGILRMGPRCSAAGNTDDFAIRLWSVPDGSALRVLEGHQSIVYKLAFSPDASLLASTSKDGSAKIWDWRNGAQIQSLSFPSETLGLSFSPDGMTLAVGGVLAWPDAAVWLFSTANWAEAGRLQEYWNIPDIAFSPDGQQMVAAAPPATSDLWNTAGGGRWHVVPPRTGSSIATAPTEA